MRSVRYGRYYDDILIGVSDEQAGQALIDKVTTLLGSLGFSIRYNLSKKVRFLGYYLVVDDHKKRVLALAPTDLIKRRFYMRFKEHFDSVEQEMGSEQLVVKRI